MFISDLDAAIEADTHTKLQTIEHGLLETAKDTYEFISKHEYIDLCRLRDDRNLCAHPAFRSEDELFQPAPELVRVHIVHSVMHLLQYPPTQGKSAIKHIVEEITRRSFSTTLDGATLILGRYINHAKASLIRNVVRLLIKALLRGGDATLSGHEQAALLALNVVARQH